MMMARSLVAPLFLLVCMGCPETRPQGPVDFTRLVSEAYPAPGKRNDIKTEELWLELNKLPKWHFTTTRDLVGQKQPAIELLGDGSWLIASTDLQIARAYAEKRGRAMNKVAPVDAGGSLPASPFEIAAVPAPTPAPAAAPDAALEAAKPNTYLAEDGTPLVVTMTPDEAAAYLKAYSGPPLAGVRFNEGAPRNFFGDLEAVVSIHTELKAKGLLPAPKK